MPAGGAVTLADMRQPTIEIVCEPCGRHGRYAVERLIANCPKARSFSIYDRCKARFARYYGP